LPDKKETSSDEVMQEALDNARSDRKRLEEHLASLNEQIGMLVGPDSPITVANILDMATKATDSMTRSNSQILEVAKLKVKKEGPVGDGKPQNLNDDEKEDMYEEIEDGQAN
jgi:hypothetical protein